MGLSILTRLTRSTEHLSFGPTTDSWPLQSALQPMRLRDPACGAGPQMQRAGGQPKTSAQHPKEA